jgi:hypothetical protein
VYFETLRTADKIAGCEISKYLIMYQIATIEMFLELRADVRIDVEKTGFTDNANGKLHFVESSRYCILITVRIEARGGLSVRKTSLPGKQYFYLHQKVYIPKDLVILCKTKTQRHVFHLPYHATCTSPRTPQSTLSLQCTRNDYISPAHPMNLLMRGVGMRVIECFASPE